MLKKTIEFTTATPAPKQTALLVNSFTKVEKKVVAEETGMLDIVIKPEEMLALKAKLGMPWEKLKTVGR